MKSIKEYIIESTSEIKPFSNDSVQVKYGTIDDIVKLVHDKKTVDDNCDGWTNSVTIALPGKFNEKASSGRVAPKKLYSLGIKLKKDVQIWRLWDDDRYEFTKDNIVNVYAVYWDKYNEELKYWNSKKLDIKDTNNIPIQVD